MNFSIGPSTSIRAVKNHLIADTPEAIKESKERQERLEKIATIQVGKEVHVHIEGDHAEVELADSDDKLGYTDRLIITVRQEIPSQSRTNMDQEKWDLMVQRTDVYHEIGHIKYTDWPMFEDVLFGDGNGNYGIPGEHQGLFKSMWNGIEDIAVENLLVEDVDIEDELRITNENLFHNNKPKGTVSLHEAMSLAIMEYKHPTGFIDELLDENEDDIQFISDDDREIFVEHIKPPIDNLVPYIGSTGDAERRNLLIYNLYQQIGLYFDRGIMPGEDETHDFDKPDDADNQGAGLPATDMDPDSMPDIEPPDPDEMEVGLDVDTQKDYDDKIQQDKDADDSDAQAADLEEWIRIIEEEYDDGTTLSLQLPNDPPDNGSFDDGTYQSAKNLGSTLAKDLRQRLQQQRNTQKQKKKQSGKPDQSQLHKTQQGKANVFSKTSDPDGKEYACMILVDGSGSTNAGDLIVDIEEAGGALAFALEEVDVDVGVLSVRNDNIWLEKDFNEDVEEAKQKMFRGYAKGSTPFSEALLLAKSRLELAGDSPFVIALTDGEPDHRERYRDVLDQCNFPVVGVYLNKDGSFTESHINENSYFHSLKMREGDKAIDGVRSMIHDILF